MNLTEAKLSVIIAIYQQMVSSLLRRYDIESDKEEREKLLTEVNEIVEFIQTLQP